LGGSRWLKVVTPGEVSWAAGSRFYGISMDNKVLVSSDGASFTASGATGATDIAAAPDGTVIYIGPSRNLYRVDPATGVSLGQFDSGTQLDRISVASANLIWGVKDGKVYRRASPGNWVEVAVPEPFREVTVSHDAAVCGISQTNKVYTYSPS
jgi:outer membrane protein assembly factor BamB